MFFFAKRYGMLGEEEYKGSELVGWKVVFRRWHDPKFSPPIQRLRFNTPNKFSVYRALIQGGRDWFGKQFFLKIESIEPIYKAYYELIDW